MLTLSEQFVDFLHKMSFKRRAIAQQVLGLRIFYVDLSPLRLRFSDRSPLIEVPRQEIKSRSYEEIYDTLKDIILQLQIHDRIPIILLEGHSAEFRSLANRPPYCMVVLDQEDMTSIVESRAPSDRLLALIRYQIPLSFLSPYEVSAPVTGSQFFGREYEIRTILGHPDTSYTIIGTRRIGKTSLLKEIQRRMEAAESDARRLLYIDCMAFNDTAAFFEQIVSRLYPREYSRLWRMGANYAGYFPQFMKRMKAMYKGKIVLFMDEIDHLLKLDRRNDYVIMRALRACSEEQSCRLIFSGFREAQKEFGAVDSPLHFTTTVLILSNLNQGDAADLIINPMNSLGVKLVNPDQVIRRIYHETAGHPNFIQHYCLTLIRQLDETGTREITLEHLAKLSDDEGFRIRVLETFVFNTNDLEKAIAYVVADKPRFTVEDVDRQLKRYRLFLDVRELEDACRKLESLGIIEQKDQAFRFTIPIFPQLLSERYSRGFLVMKANEYAKLKTRVRSAYD